MPQLVLDAVLRIVVVVPVLRVLIEDWLYVLNGLYVRVASQVVVMEDLRHPS
jgi:hypothetical protein